MCGFGAQKLLEGVRDWEDRTHRRPRRRLRLPASAAVSLQQVPEQWLPPCVPGSARSTYCATTVESHTAFIGRPSWLSNSVGSVRFQTSCGRARSRYCGMHPEQRPGRAAPVACRYRPAPAPLRPRPPSEYCAVAAGYAVAGPSPPLGWPGRLKATDHYCGSPNPPILVTPLT